MTGGGDHGVYVARLDLAAPHHAGVALKIAAQAESLGKAGLPCKVLAIHGDAVTLDGGALRYARGPLGRRRMAAIDFYREAAEAAEGARFVYIRHQRATPALLTMLRRIRRGRPGCPILMEVPTWPYSAERSGARDRVLGAVDEFCCRGLRGLVDRIVSFSGEPTIWGVPTLRTQNGVALPSETAGAPPPPPPLRLVAVANLGIRHAYDRVIDGLSAYARRPGGMAVTLEIVGSGTSEADLRARVARAGLQAVVSFAGPRMGADLDRRMAGAHVGVAALGMHRIGADTQDLKSREYCARGLPFVTSNADPDFPPGTPFVHRVPADDSPVDIAALVAWHGRLMRDHPGYRAEMRAHARAHLTWDAKMAPVADYLQGRLRGVAA
jgi:hypothetical protein